MKNDTNEINRKQYWRWNEKCSQISMGFKKGQCVCLTNEGKAHIDHLREEACKSKIDPRNHIISHLRDDIKYYYKIPFITSSEPSIVVDLRSSDEVAGRLMQFILSGKADKCWNPLVVSEKDE